MKKQMKVDHLEKNPHMRHIKWVHRVHIKGKKFKPLKKNSGT